MFRNRLYIKKKKKILIKPIKKELNDNRSINRIIAVARGAATELRLEDYDVAIITARAEEPV